MRMQDSLLLINLRVTVGMIGRIRMSEKEFLERKAADAGDALELAKQEIMQLGTDKDILQADQMKDRYTIELLKDKIEC